jgi:hypothetical protein
MSLGKGLAYYAYFVAAVFGDLCEPCVNRGPVPGFCGIHGLSVDVQVFALTVIHVVNSIVGRVWHGSFLFHEKAP